MTICPLCSEAALEFFTRSAASSQEFHACTCCGLVVRDERYLLDSASEREKYLDHENDPADPRYRAFLSRLAQPMLDLLNSENHAESRSGLRGLDFGCGPTRAMELIFCENDLSCRSYDPHFFPDATALSGTYDFVTCSEAAEHFYRPGREFTKLDSLLASGGVLGVMSALPPVGADAFSRWHYQVDPTHVAFYGERTRRWIAERFGWSCRLVSDSVVLYVKP